MADAKSKHDSFKDQAPVPEKSIIIKNIIFGIFVILSILFCFQKYFERAKLVEYNEGMRLYDEGIQLLNSEDTKAYAFLRFSQAEAYFEEYLASDVEQEIVIKSTQMMGQCFAMMATCPNINGEQAADFYRQALAADFDCPLVSDVIRLKYGSMEDDERKAIEERIRTNAESIPAEPMDIEVPAEVPATPAPAEVPATPAPEAK